MTRYVLVTLSMVALLGISGCGGSTNEVTAGGSATSAAPSDGSDGGGQPAPPDGPADIAGPITSATPFEAVTEDCTDPQGSSPDTAVSSDDPPACTPADSDSVGSILIEKGTGSVDAASIRVTADTRLLAAYGSGWQLTTFDQLAAGTRVRVWFTGPVAESYPVQATAATIALNP